MTRALTLIDQYKAASYEDTLENSELLGTSIAISNIQMAMDMEADVDDYIENMADTLVEMGRGEDQIAYESAQVVARHLVAANKLTSVHFPHA